MKKTLVGFIVGFLLCAAATATPRVRPDFGVVFNDDADLAFVVPDRAKAEEFLRLNVSALADTPVKTFVYCIGMGGDLLYYNTEVASRVGWRKSPDEKPGSLMEKRMENARVCLAQGADAVRTAGETAKQLGLRFIPSLRMNDAHFMANPDAHAMTSEFWFKHRHEYTIKESPLAFQAAYGNLLDYTHAAVRQLRLDTVFEALARNRELVDGFELDFNRFQVFFPKGKATVGAPLITELVRHVRARLDELAVSEKRPMYLFVRVPPSVTDCTTAGLEVERWMREGLVDLVSPAQIMTLAGDMPIADLVALAKPHGVRVHASLYPRTAWRLPFPAAGENRYAGTAVGRNGTLEEIRGAAANYRAMGADGFYLFNFYNAFGAERPHDDRLYHVFRDLARTENLRGQSAVYAVTKSNYFDGPGSYAYGKQLPTKLAPGVTSRIVLSIAENLSAGPFPLQACELRVGLRAVPEGATVAIALNGKPLFDGPPTSGVRVVTKQLVKTPPRQPDQAEEYLHVALTAGLRPVRGANEFALTVAGASKPVEVTDLEVRYDYQNDLEKIWNRVPVR
jgi:hypothetical protein